MSSIMKVFLLLAVMAVAAKAQFDRSGRQCLCSRVRNKIPQGIKDIQISPATNFCNQIEVVVTLKNGLRFCLNPNHKPVKKVIETLIKQKNAATTSSAMTSSAPSSSTTASL